MPPRTRGQKKVRLLRKAEKMIEELLDWTDTTKEPNMTQIEEKVLALRQEFSEAMSREVIESQETKQLAASPPCPKCGEETRYKGQKRIEPQTWVGEVRFKRGYYYCEKCKVGFFPPG